MKNNSKKPTFTGATNSLKFQYQIGAFIGFTWLAITTALLIYNNAIEKLPEYFSSMQYASWGAWGAVIFGYFLLDFGHANNLSIYLDYKDDKKENDSQLRLMFVITLIQLTGTTLASLWLAPDAAKFMTKEHDADKYFQMVETNNDFRQAQTASLDSSILALEQSQHQRKETALAKANNVIRRAVNSGDRWQRRSYKNEGLNWLANRNNTDRNDHKYATTILNARTIADSIINAESALLESAIQTKQSYLQDTTSTAYTAALLREEKDAHQEHLANLDKNKNIFIAADIFALFIALISVYMLYTIRVLNKEKIDNRSIHLVLAKFAGKLYLKLINFLEKLLNIDINGDGLIAGKEPTETPVPAVSTVPTQPGTTVPAYPKKTIVRGFLNTISVPVPAQPQTQSQNVVAQQVNTTPLSPETLPKTTVPAQPEKIIETRIVTTPREDIKKWIKYAKIYYERSKTSKSIEARENNRKRYEENKSLLEITGKYKITEGPKKVVIEEV